MSRRQNRLGFSSTLVNRAIPSLINGISQQSPALRRETQSEDEVNCYQSLVQGNGKRPPVVLEAVLSGVTVGNDTFVHWINRSATERYVVIINASGVRVFDLNGVAQTVNVTTAANTYLTSGGTNYASKLTAATSFDFTFLCNRTVQVAASASLSPALSLTPVNQINQLYPYQRGVQDGSSNIISPAGFAGGAFPGGANFVQGPPANGTGVRVDGSNGNPLDRYYLVWQGAWQETLAGGQQFAFNTSTMPVSLVRNTNGTWTVDVVPWASRTVGDANNTPYPSFVGTKVNDLFIYKNRIVFLAEDAVVMTRLGADEFNFWPTTKTAVLDTDPIDIRVGDAVTVSNLAYGLAFDKSLLLFTDSAQFIITSREFLSPKTVSVDLTTSFPAQRDVKAVAAGPNVYFVSPRGTFSAVRELFVDGETFLNDAANVTAHVPQYLQDVRQMVSFANDDLLLFRQAASNTLYTYKYYWNGDEKVQSAWSRWELPEDCIIRSIGILGGRLYMVLERDGVAMLASARLSATAVDAPLPFRVHLDLRTLVTGTYNATTNETTLTLPYPHRSNVQVVVPGGHPAGGVGDRLTVLSYPSATTARVRGDWSAAGLFVGVPYTQRYVFSEQFLRDGSGVAVTDGRLMMRYLNVSYASTSRFTVKVTPKGRQTREYTFSGRTLGDTVLGEVPVVNGTFRVPLMADSRELEIVLENDTYLPSNFTGADWTALYHPRSGR